MHRKQSFTGEYITVNYVRVSSQDQKADLERQVRALEAYSTAHGGRS
ncbi:MAG: recombinase family protein [Cyanobacteria bacterium J06636_16]